MVVGVGDKSEGHGELSIHGGVSYIISTKWNLNFQVLQKKMEHIWSSACFSNPQMHGSVALWENFNS